MPRRKPKRRENRSGTIMKLGGFRRKPYAVRVTVGTDQRNGRPIRKYLAYFETEAEAQHYLDMYNLLRKGKNSPSVQRQAKTLDADIYQHLHDMQQAEDSTPTFAEVFEILYDERYRFITTAQRRRSFFMKFSELHGRKVNDITFFELQKCLDDVKAEGLSATVLSNMKSTACDIFEWSVIHQYIGRNDDYTSYLDVSVKDRKEKKAIHKPFSIEEIRRLIRDGSPTAKMVLIFIFTGCRPVELVTIDPSQIFIGAACDDGSGTSMISYMITGSKTDAGRNRIVPIHRIVEPYITELLDAHPTYLFYDRGLSPHKAFTRYSRKFAAFMAALGMDHLPYDTRHTFSTLADLCGMDPYCQKKIMGHKVNDITQDVYTHTLKSRLYNEVQKIKIDV